MEVIIGKVGGFYWVRVSETCNRPLDNDWSQIKRFYQKTCSVNSVNCKGGVDGDDKS